MAEKKKRSLSDDLKQYADRSISGLGRMRDEVREILRSVPQPVHDASDTVRPFLPGYGFMESVRLGNEAGGHWRDGDYGKSLVKFSESLDAPFDEVYWLLAGLPGKAVR